MDATISNITRVAGSVAFTGTSIRYTPPRLGNLVECDAEACDRTANMHLSHSLVEGPGVHLCHIHFPLRAQEVAASYALRLADHFALHAVEQTQQAIETRHAARAAIEAATPAPPAATKVKRTRRTQPNDCWCGECTIDHTRDR